MEEWKVIEGYDGKYLISSYGRVKSTKGKEKILKLGRDTKGYLRVSLSKNGKQETKKVHRLVAEVFIPKIEGKEFVDHIDSNRQNNNVNNLRWCTIVENNNFDLYRKHMSEAKKGEKHHMYGKTGALHNRSKIVLCIETGKIYGSTMEAGRETGINQSSISAVCNSRRKSAGGYHWKYIELLPCYN